KFFQVLTEVLFDGVKSAEPPNSSGSTSAVALSTAPNAARLATFPFSLVNGGIFFAQSLGRRPSRRRASSVDSSGQSFTYAFPLAVHAACSAAPFALALRQFSSAAGGTKNGSRLGQPR